MNTLTSEILEQVETALRKAKKHHQTTISVGAAPTIRAYTTEEVTWGRWGRKWPEKSITRHVEITLAKNWKKRVVERFGSATIDDHLIVHIVRTTKQCTKVLVPKSGT